MHPDGRVDPRPRAGRFTFEPYEPDHWRYGGTDGAALAEWHFQHSSDLAIDLHITHHASGRSGASLASAAQTMLAMAVAFLAGPGELDAYFKRYADHWRSALRKNGHAAADSSKRIRHDLPVGFERQLHELLRTLRRDRPEALPALMRAWFRHCQALSDRALQCARQDRLVLPVWDRVPAEAECRRDEDTKQLLFDYMHLMNNRLCLTVGDEAALADVLHTAIRQATPGLGDSGQS